jgi:hypothetical protein
MTKQKSTSDHTHRMMGNLRMKSKEKRANIVDEDEEQGQSLKKWFK